MGVRVGGRGGENKAREEDDYRGGRGGRGERGCKSQGKGEREVDVSIEG